MHDKRFGHDTPKIFSHMEQYLQMFVQWVLELITIKLIGFDSGFPPQGMLRGVR
jgi:hypothetical protein